MGYKSANPPVYKIYTPKLQDEAYCGRLKSENHIIDLYHPCTSDSPWLVKYSKYDTKRPQSHIHIDPDSLVILKKIDENKITLSVSTYEYIDIPEINWVLDISLMEDLHKLLKCRLERYRRE